VFPGDSVSCERDYLESVALHVAVGRRATGERGEAIGGDPDDFLDRVQAALVPDPVTVLPTGLPAGPRRCGAQLRVKALQGGEERLAARGGNRYGLSVPPIGCGTLSRLQGSCYSLLSQERG
jgi:hypothetical protein